MTAALNPISGIDGPQVSLAAAAVTGAGAMVLFSRPRGVISMQVSFAGGSPTVKVYLEGTIDGTNWFRLGTFDTGAGGVNGDIVTSTNVVVTQARANLNTLSGGSSPTVSASIMPSAFN